MNHLVGYKFDTSIYVLIKLLSQACVRETFGHIINSNPEN